MKLFSDNRGIALLITLSVTTLLVAVAIEYNRRARFSVISTAMARNGVSLRQMAAGGVHAGMAILVKDKADSTIDSLLEDWADPDKVEVLVDTDNWRNPDSWLILPTGEGGLGNGSSAWDVLVTSRDVVWTMAPTSRSR